jgi:hypothetical protein
MAYYLLVCLECADPERTASPIMPFGSAAERGKWASAHTRGTGHDRWWVKDDTTEGADDGTTAP